VRTECPISLKHALAAVTLALTLALAGAVGGAQAASAPADNPGVNTEPIDWTIDTPFIGRFGEMIPLRVGQHDDKINKADGFGRRHVIDAHGAVPPPEVIADVLLFGDC